MSEHDGIAKKKQCKKNSFEVYVSFFAFAKITSEMWTVYIQKKISTKKTP
jgi:hypothetical protein